MKLNLPTHACDAARLDSFLSGDLSEPEERDFTRHLDACESCRRAVTDRAADPAVWREVKSLLMPSQFDDQCDGSSDLDLTGTATRQPQQLQHVLDALGPTDDPEMLGRLGGYEISGIVGAGGMGVVLKAIDKSLDRTVAIKVLAPHLATSGAPRKRFAREAKAAAAVIHPNVIAIHSVSNDEALPYLVMPYLRGSSLQKRLDTEGPLTLREILRIGAQIAAGLAAAHAQGLVHRDIKPANILLEDGVERVTITDFGLARAVDDATITHCGAIAGTPQYMSPEQARGEPVDARSDLFSLGSVLYAISTGRAPFRAETSYGVMRRITDDEPKPIQELNPDVPSWLGSIIARLMSKQASERFASAVEVAELLEKCLAHVQQPVAVPLPASLAPQRNRVRIVSALRPWIGVITMLAAISFGLLGLLAWQATEAPDIAGNWTGQEWGEVVLKKTGDAEYAGTYSSTFGKQPGELQLKWSRVERRYYGTWREGNDRLGELSIRLVGDEIRGAHTTDPKSKINPQAPRLADLAWTRSQARTAQRKPAAFGPVWEGVVRNREAIDFDMWDQALIPSAELNPEKGLLWILEQRLGAVTDWMAEKKMDAISEGSCLIAFGLKVNELTNADWDTLDSSKLSDAVAVDWRRVNPRQFVRAIDTVDPQAPPHVILALRGRTRTFAIQTREGGLGILQILETTKEGFKIRFKLAAIDTKRDTERSEWRTNVIALKFAKAESAGKVLWTFVKENGYSANIVADPATNSVIISAPEEQIRLIAALVQRLDATSQPPEPRSNPLQVKPEEKHPDGSALLPGASPKFSETTEIVLSMDGSKFMLDFDSGQTMDAPATTGRPEQMLMDVQTDQYQPYHYPKELIGLGLRGVEVKASDWDASAMAVERALAGKTVEPLKQMDLGPEKHPTYFFKTRDGAEGILQLLEIVDEPKGIRLRYKTVKSAAAKPRSPLLPKLLGRVTAFVHSGQEFVEISLGSDDGLKVGDSLIVFRDDTYLGKITVLNLMPGKSVARVESRKGEIRGGESVVMGSLPEAPPRNPAQVKIEAPKDMVVAIADGHGSFANSPPFIVPVRLNLLVGKTYRLKITNIPGRDGAELYPTVEIASTTKGTEEFLDHNAIPVQFTEEDFDQVLAGKLITKVIYLPDQKTRELAPIGAETLVSSRLDPGADPLVEADRRGLILAVFRVGNKDIELPGNPPPAPTPREPKPEEKDPE